jgi:AraC-like DNA-binding protein
MHYQLPSGVPDIRRQEKFGSLVNETFFPMSCRPVRDYEGRFFGALSSQSIGGVGFATVKGSPLDVYRRRRHIGKVTDASYLVKVQVEGESLIHHWGREAHLRPGDFTLCLSSEPYDLHFAEPYHQVVLAVPQGLMEECVRQPTQHLGVRMDSAIAANGLFSQFVMSISSRLETMDGVLAQRLEANVMDLLSTTLGYAQESNKHDLLNLGVKCEYLQRIKHYIRRNLHEEHLCLDMIASAHKISTRYLHMLFEEENESVSRYIQRLRLSSCKASLADADFKTYSVSEIAYNWGFKDASHFSRAFKSEFGDTPASYRKHSLSGGDRAH